ncbi:LytR/AlgR family response regulator transcription factor [Spirochaeta isovalerica]|uniref:DNA-binding LytR/AlgR family response regulator n=1 Tax=Spirochaeta isovalerica TaxID=150 RepID=A0A841RCI8_9SPIO|nr:response regulator transcription factor [Spirochaeta isovalerica]MBB6480947.1 DNA-binding LytR/AlgR family response regulator [Spirochaeta isovalerica]
MPAHKIKVLIADDEAPARKRLKTLLEPYENLQICAEAEDGDQVLRLIIEKSPDLAFLDINMPGASVFNTIPSLKSPPLIVFQTAYSQYGADAYNIDAIDYLMKPVSRERFARAIDKVMEKLDMTGKEKFTHNPDTHPEKNSDVISVKSGESLRIIRIDMIRRVSFEDGFSFIHSGDEKIYSDKPLSHFVSQLENRGFYQVSRSDLISLKKLAKLHPFFNGQYVAEMTNGEKVHVSRRRVQGLKELIGS